MQPADFSILFFLIERVGPGIVDPGDLAGHGDTADKCSRPRRNWRLPLDFQIDRIVGTVKDRVPVDSIFPSEDLGLLSTA
jgi:hypothetical protein